MSNPNRNVQFVDACGVVFGGFFQNGSITYSDVHDFLRLTLVNHVSRYTLYRCTEPGVPASPLLHHGPPILILNNNLAIPPAYYVVLSSGMPVPSCYLPP